MKKLLFLLLFIPLVSCDFTQKKTYSSSDIDFDTVLRRGAEKMNEMCPMMADKDTRMDNVVLLSNSRVLYNYTLINNLVSDFTDEYLDNEFATILVNRVKTNPGLSLWRENNVTFIYHYEDRKGVTIRQYVIRPENYKENEKVDVINNLEKIL